MTDDQPGGEGTAGPSLSPAVRSGGRGTRSPGPDPDLDPAPALIRPARHRGRPGTRLGRLAEVAGSAAAELLALAVPVECVCCGAEDAVLCAACEQRLRSLTSAPFRAEEPAPSLMDMDGSVLLPVVAAGAYRDELAQCILSFKRHGQRTLGRALGRGLLRALACAAGPSGGILVVPVPTTGRAFLKRGFSPVDLLLRGMPPGPAAGRFTVIDALRRPWRFSAGPGQKGLGSGARAQRIRGAMRLRPGAGSPLRGRPCLIVDDVLTTGATLAEAARAVRSGGGQVVGAVVLAATRPPAHAGYRSGAPQSAGKGGGTEKNKPEKDE